LEVISAVEISDPEVGKILAVEEGHFADVER
jgi:hypothetical protein